jgi:hypothetical protein
MEPDPDPYLRLTDPDTRGPKHIRIRNRMPNTGQKCKKPINISKNGYKQILDFHSPFKILSTHRNYEILSKSLVPTEGPYFGQAFLWAWDVGKKLYFKDLK